MTEFTPVSSTLGGVLIGLSASWMLLAHGRIAGISGIFGPLLRPRAGDIGWRVAFLFGLAVAGIAATLVAPETLATPSTRSVGVVAFAGVLVGFGVRMGNGCTSGHGVCGLPRLSPRSIVAVITFMTTGAIAATVARLTLGGT